ncbi:hypothetical protein DXF93_01410 [Escherichia coli]|nr:hypothetical protein DXF93_01410 [Escherichia coli]
MPRNFFNILRDNPESWGGKQNPLTLPTTRSSDKAQKSSATVKISAVCFLCYKQPDSFRNEQWRDSSLPCVCNLSKVKTSVRAVAIWRADKHTPIRTIQRALFYVKTA